MEREQLCAKTVNKIPCIVLIYWEFDFIKTTIDYLLKYTQELDLYVVENSSKNTNTVIKPYILDLINQQKIKKYFLFDFNISNNAMEMVLNSEELDINDSKYILLTDGDLLPENDEWLSEQLKILENNLDVFCCGLNMTLTNLPVEVIPSSVNWYPKPLEIHEDYEEGMTGHHFMMLRSRELKLFLKYQQKNNLKYVDSVIQAYCYSVLGKKWARTKVSKVRHLKWDIVNKNYDHSYLNKKRLVRQTWYHDFYSSYEVFGQKHYYRKYGVPDGLLIGSIFAEDPQPHFSQLTPPYKLNIGCGPVRINSWINIDSDIIPGITDLKLDITRGLPFDDNSCSLIYHEHLLQKLPVKEGMIFLQECKRVLKEDGVMRIAMTSLDALIEKCYLGNWKDQAWLNLPRYHHIQSRAEMLNIVFRSWNNQWLYDKEELHRRLYEVGFGVVKDVDWGKSNISELVNKEKRQDSLLICEAYKSKYSHSEFTTMNKKIPCIVLIYENLNSIEHCLKFLVQYEKYLDIYLIENFSIYSEPDIKKLSDELLSKGLIRKHIRFKENITNNAIQVCLNENLIDLQNHDKVIITDGDVVSNSENWIEELNNVLDKHKDVFCVSPKMRIDKWMSHFKMPEVTKETDDYIVCGTGIWLCMFRTSELLDVMRIFKENGFRFADGRINEFARCVRGQHWVMAKRVEQEELNRSQEFWNKEYQDNKQLVVNVFGGHAKLWNHDRVAICEIFTLEGSEIYTPQELFPPVRERAETIDSDYIVDVINNRSREKPLQLFFDVPISSVKQGWVNLGVISPQRSFYESQSDTYYVNCYARAEKLPKFNSAFDMIYIYHSLNRSTDAESINILRQIKNWLVDKGNIRIVVPSIQKILDIYLKKDFETLEILKPFLKLPKHYVTECFSDYLHWFLVRPNIKAIYDQEKLEKILEMSNLPKPQPSQYQPEVDVNGPVVARFSDFYDIRL